MTRHSPIAAQTDSSAADWVTGANDPSRRCRRSMTPDLFPVAGAWDAIHRSDPKGGSHGRKPERRSARRTTTHGAHRRNRPCSAVSSDAECSAARLVKAAVLTGREKGISVGLFRPVSLWPFPYQPLRQLARKSRKFLVVEMNLGQMVEDVRLAVEGASPVSFYGRPGGGVPTPEEILGVVKKLIK